MCLSIPARILSVEANRATVEFEGNDIEVDLSLVPDAGPGDFVLVHAGFAIQKYEEEEARETLALLREAFGDTRPEL